jgi:hypothetical protein
MANFSSSAAVIIQLCFLILAGYTSSTAGINLENRVSQLEKKCVRCISIPVHFVFTTDNRTHYHNNFFPVLKVNVIETLEAKVVTLETKVARLEAKVEQQESQIAALIVNEREKQQSSTTNKFTTSVELNQNYKRNVIFRTCHELHSSNPLLESGMYWIDPDGQGVGDDAIHVFCDMKLGIEPFCYFFI